MNICKNCGVKTKNPVFCSRSCSITYNNRIKPKKIARPKTPRRCIYCREQLIPVETYKGKRVCFNCRQNGHGQYDFVKRSRKNNKLRLLNEVGDNKCFICGYNKCSDVLEFHHINPNNKSFTLSYNMNKAYEDLLVEAKKCVVLCANCHREVEAGITTLSL